MPFLTPETTPVATVCRRLFIPDSPEWLALVNGALAELIKLANWEAFGAVTPAEAAARAQQMVLDYLESSCMLGTVHPYVTSSPPAGCLPCDGSQHQRADYPRLYEALPAALIVDADSFLTPDLRNRFVYGAGTLAPLEIGGAAAVSLTAAENGPHTHTTVPHTHADLGHSHVRPNSPGVTLPVVSPGEAFALAPSLIPGSTLPASANLASVSVTVNESGTGAAHENMPPYYVLAYCIVAR